MKLGNILVCCPVVVLLVTTVGANLQRNGSNVCSYAEDSYKMKVMSTQGFTTAVTTKETCCGWFCSRNCTERVTKTISKIMYMHRAVKVRKDVFYCCSGWGTDPERPTECTKPICSVACQNGGQCVAPGKCKCAKGFQGTYCQNDINECNDKLLNTCHQSCINLPGSYKCGCNRGFQLGSDGKCNDIDECSYGVCKCAKYTRKCTATCVNTPGSYRCSCPKGYEQRIPEICQDRNECVENSSICHQVCENVEAGYKCKCFKGYMKDPLTGKCVDFDECSQNNGGCSHTCHNVLGGRVCSCPTGFYLGEDRKTCEGIKTSDKEVYICEGEWKTLNCFYPKIIGILHATYGRLSSNYCQKGNYTTSNTCQFADVMRYMTKRCDNKAFCSVFSSTKVFKLGTKDPCPSTSKYLHLIYRCIDGDV